MNVALSRRIDLDETILCWFVIRKNYFKGGDYPERFIFKYSCTIILALSEKRRYDDEITAKASPIVLCL